MPHWALCLVFSADHSKAVPLLQNIFVLISVINCLFHGAFGTFGRPCFASVQVRKSFLSDNMYLPLQNRLYGWVLWIDAFDKTF